MEEEIAESVHELRLQATEEAEEESGGLRAD